MLLLLIQLKEFTVVLQRKLALASNPLAEGNVILSPTERVNYKTVQFCDLPKVATPRL